MEQESFCFSIDPIAYSPLPRFLPPALAREYSHCIYLENASFYEMFTFAICELLFRGRAGGAGEAGEGRLGKLKELVCSNGFLNFANFTKGLILKGLRAMAESAGSSNSPVAEVLLGSEKMPAFCECWKEMLFHFKSKHQEVGDINSSMIEVFTRFFEVDFRFYSRKGKDFLEEVIRGGEEPAGGGGARTRDQISVLLISASSEEDEYSAKEQSISSISSIYGNWSYYVLLPAALTCPAPSREDDGAVELPLSKQDSRSRLKGRRATIAIDYPELFAIDEEKSQVKWKVEPCEAVVGNARRVVGRGFELLERMREFNDKLIAN